MDNDKRIALLIDADNVSNKYIQYIMDEVSNYGTPTYKRIYGDWTKPQLASWKPTLLNHSITPIQQYNYTTGKNSTDAALIIDAMDILYTGKVDGFCIVSSDSDFTRLASRLREAGMLVVGMGETKTPEPFRAACDRFVYLEVLSVNEDDAEADTNGTPMQTAIKPKSRTTAGEEKRVIKALKAIVTELSDEDGWAHLSAVGNRLSRRLPDFDTRNFGYNKMSSWVESLKDFELELRSDDTRHSSRQAYIRIKANPKRTARVRK